MLPEFERRSGIRVDVQQIPWTSAHEKMLTAYVGESTPDVAKVGNTWIPEFEAIEAIEDLTPRVAQSRSVDRADYFDAIWETNVPHPAESGQRVQTSDIQWRMLDINTLWPAIAVVMYVVCFVVFRRGHDKSKGRPPMVDTTDDDVVVLWPERLEDRKDNVEQVKLLFEYTKFHITVYTTLASLLGGVIAAAGAQRFRIAYKLLPAAVVAILAAGWAAGVVAASMPECTRLQNFWNWRTGPYRTHWMTIRGWTYLEHTSFWLAVMLVVIAFVVGEPTPATPEITISIKGG